MAGKQLVGKQRTANLNFARDILTELKKVVWPTREQATNLTTIVIAVSIAVGAFLGTVDFLFSWIINQVLLGR